jgi:aspartate kinase
MKIFKFGGASIKDADSVRNIPKILSRYPGEQLVIIVSAMGKTTNALELLAEAAYHDDPATDQLYRELYANHMDIATALFANGKHSVFEQLEDIFTSLQSRLSTPSLRQHRDTYDMYYDQVVPAGELLSTRIISAFLEDEGIVNTWLDARELVITDSIYRAARVDWDRTADNIRKKCVGDRIISQGFIGSDGKYSTTLGREGSDFTAAIFAHVLDAEEVVVWKDVPGYMNADPQYFSDTVKLDRISYSESIELSFYGAKIIHPKTIRPLKNKNIPLRVKSFLDPTAEGSLIQGDQGADALVPSCIIKEKQVLVSISSRDFSFIAEDHLHRIFGIFASHRCGINLMQNSAISFSVCIDDNERLQDLIGELQDDFRIRYNKGLRLITIRHYDDDTIDRLTSGKKIFLEQKSRLTAQYVVK